MNSPKELTELLNFLFNVGKGVQKSMADDGKVSLFEAAGLLRFAGEAREALSGLGQLDDELKDLTPAQTEEINRLVASHFPGLLSERQTQIVGAAQQLLPPLVNFIAVLRQPAGTAAPVAPAEAA